MGDFKWIEQPRRQCKKIFIRTNTCRYFLLFFWIPNFFIYQRHKMGLAYCFLNSLRSLVILCSDRLFKTLMFLCSCSTCHPSVPEVNLVFFLMNNVFSFLRIWLLLSPVCQTWTRLPHSLYQILNMLRNASMFAHGSWG